MPQQPQSVLFCCDHNAVRSPMAEGIMKKLYGTDLYVQSAGLRNDLEIDGFAIAVCDEIGVKLHRHRSRSFEEMEQWGEPLSGFDLVVALSPASFAKAEALTRFYHTEVVHWPVCDPTGQGEDRATKLAVYRRARDGIVHHLQGRWGVPHHHGGTAP